MKRLLIFITALGSAFICLTAQTPLPPDTLANRLLTQTRLFPQENIYAHTDKSDYVAGDTLWFRAYLVNAISRKPENMSRYVYAELINTQADTVVSRVKARQDSLGMTYGYVPLPPSLPKGIYRLRAYTRYACNWGKDSFFHKAVRIYPARKTDKQNSSTAPTDYQVDFFPEGGQAIDRQLCRIAFKAQNDRGNGENIRGVLTDETGDTLTRFDCLHNGMGEFSFVPLAGTSYFATCVNKEGKQKRFRLPQALSQGAALKVTADRTRCHVSVVHDSLFATDSLQLLVLQRGHPRFAGQWDYRTGTMIFPKQAFETGVVHFLLLTHKGMILSERLVFIRHPDRLSVKLSASLSRHVARQPVEVAVELQEAESDLPDGTCSVAVTDAADVPLDETTHILSTLLLTADLKGTVETPGWYFGTADSLLRSHALDLLMRTHGWRRYDLQAAIGGHYAVPAHLPETAMHLSGEVKTTFGKPAAKSSVQIFAPGTSLMTQVETDAKGRFALQGFELPDSVRYLVTALSRTGKESVGLQMQADSYPPITPRPDAAFYTGSFTHATPAVDEENYVRKTIQNIGYSEGMRHYLLGEVKVTARSKPVYQTEYEHDARVTVKEERIRQSGLPDLGTVLTAFGGINTSAILGEKSGIRLVLDGMPIEDNPGSSNPGANLSPIKWLLTAFNVDDIGQIDIIKGPLAAAYLQGKQYILIAVTTKRGGEQHNARYLSTNMAVWTPLGYQKPVEMYAPRYDKPSVTAGKPDIRTTIYWKPDVVIKSGKARFSFYTADPPSSYNVVIEGVTSEGKVFRKVEKIF